MTSAELRLGRYKMDRRKIHFFFFMRHAFPTVCKSGGFLHLGFLINGHFGISYTENSLFEKVMFEN